MAGEVLLPGGISDPPIMVPNDDDDDASYARLYYLAISPHLYPSSAQGIHHHGRPAGDAWLRVVLEKPFGRVGWHNLDRLTRIPQIMLWYPIQRLMTHSFELRFV